MKEREFDRVTLFLREHVMGRALIAQPVSTVTDAERLVSAYEEDAVYSNLAVGEHGFSFELTTLVRGTRYLPARQGGFAAEGSLNSVRVLRYEFTERASTRRLLGHARFVSSTNSAPDPFAGAVFLVQLALARSTLTLKEQMIGYADFPSSNGAFVAGAIEGSYRFVVNKGRLSVHYEHQRFSVDPLTMERKPTGDELTAQISYEIVFPDPELKAA